MPDQHHTSRYGNIGQRGEWQEVIEAYHWDRMAEAYQSALALGAGFGGSVLKLYRMIEGEALVRERATLQEVTTWLTVEWDTDEVEFSSADFEDMRQTCTDVAVRLGWQFEMGVRVAILPGEADAPWHGGRYGYCVDKYPYDKICVPQIAAAHPERLKDVLAHEFTHVITLNLTQARIPHWLDEGLAMLMEDSAPPVSSHWMEPVALNAAFEVDRRDPEGLSYATSAYAQGAALVRHLHGLGGDEKLAQLLRSFTNNSLLTEMRINLLGEPSVEEALHEVYGLSQRELFAAVQG